MAASPNPPRSARGLAYSLRGSLRGMQRASANDLGCGCACDWRALHAGVPGSHGPWAVLVRPGRSLAVPHRTALRATNQSSLRSPLCFVRGPIAPAQPGASHQLLQPPTFVKITGSRRVLVRRTKAVESPEGPNR